MRCFRKIYAIISQVILFKYLTTLHNFDIMYSRPFQLYDQKRRNFLMSWTDNRTPVSAAIRMETATQQLSYRNADGVRELIERKTIGKFKVNIIRNLDDNCVSSIIISSKKEEDIATALHTLKVFKIHIFESSKFWICTTYDAIRILETLV